MSSKTYPTNNTEQALFDSGYRFILGIDEVGRGALAGPVAVGIAVLESSMHAGRTDWPAQLCDSKLISEKVREALFAPVGSWVAGYAIGMASAQEIDELGITRCLSLAAERAVRELPAELRAQVAAAPEAATAILDGSHNWLGQALGPVSSAVKTKADRDCVSVAAASVLAKVTRDRMMGELAIIDESLARYGIAGNKGYSSQQHLDALREFGPVALHRKTWLSKILGENQLF
jgi:ribonuclease HII